MRQRSRHCNARRRPRPGDERGAVVVEAAIILPVLLLFVLGIIEWGLVFKDLQTVYSATRIGARTASAEPRQSTYPSDVASAVSSGLNAIPQGAWRELWVYKAQPSGMPIGDSGSFATCDTCVRFTWDNTGKTWTQVQNTWPATGTGSQNACAGSPDSLGVYIKVQHDMFTAMFGTSKTLADHTVIRLEPMPSGSCTG